MWFPTLIASRHYSRALPASSRGSDFMAASARHPRFQTLHLLLLALPTFGLVLW